MRKFTLAAMAGFAALASPASAQVVDSDVRCFLLSNAFAKQASDDKARSVAAASLAFYLGRLDGKTTAPGIAAAIRRDGPMIDPKTAGAQMSACAAHMTRLEQAIQAAVKAGATPK